MEPYTEEVCSICLETLLIPVEPTCFLCRKVHELGCFSVKRVCLLCLESYLALNHSRMSRPSRKCLFCPENNMPLCSKEECFRVDYGMMSRDPNQRNCPLCSFCSSHIGIARHVLKECPNYNIECECGFTCIRSDFDNHKNHCDKYALCDFCNDCVPKSILPKHMFYQHNKTRCFTCHRYVDMNELNDHLIKKCPERTITCEFCQKSIKNKTLNSHLKQHQQEIHSNMKILQQNWEKIQFMLKKK